MTVVVCCQGKVVSDEAELTIAALLAVQMPKKCNAHCHDILLSKKLAIRVLHKVSMSP